MLSFFIATLPPHEPAITSSIMDPNFDPFGGHVPRSDSRQSFDNANHLEATVQEEICQQQAHSPGCDQRYEPNYSSPPTPPATTHQQTTSQPYAAQRTPAFYPISPTGMPQSAGSPVSPYFALAPDLDYSFGLNFDSMPRRNVGMEMRNSVTQ
jgi:hypothetical protein